MERSSLTEATQAHISSGRDVLIDSISPDCANCLTVKQAATSLAEFALEKCIAADALTPHFQAVMAECTEGLVIEPVGVCGAKKICNHPRTEEHGKAITEEVVQQLEINPFGPPQQDT